MTSRFTFSIVSALLFLIIGVVLHEYIHVAIFNRFDCQTSIHFLVEDSLIQVVPESGCWDSLNERAIWRLGYLQTLVEVAGYHIVPLYPVAGFILGMNVSSEQ